MGDRTPAFPSDHGDLMVPRCGSPLHTKTQPRTQEQDAQAQTVEKGIAPSRSLPNQLCVGVLSSVLKLLPPPSPLASVAVGSGEVSVSSVLRERVVSGCVSVSVRALRADRGPFAFRLVRCGNGGRRSVCLKVSRRVGGVRLTSLNRAPNRAHVQIKLTQSGRGVGNQDDNETRPRRDSTCASSTKTRAFRPTPRPSWAAAGSTGPLRGLGSQSRPRPR